MICSLQRSPVSCTVFSVSYSGVSCICRLIAGLSVFLDYVYWFVDPMLDSQNNWSLALKFNSGDDWCGCERSGEGDQGLHFASSYPECWTYWELSSSWRWKGGLLLMSFGAWDWGVVSVLSSVPYQYDIENEVVEFVQMTCLTIITTLQRQTTPPFKQGSRRKVSAQLFPLIPFSMAMYVRWTTLTQLGHKLTFLPSIETSGSDFRFCNKLRTQSCVFLCIHWMTPLFFGGMDLLRLTQTIYTFRDGGFICGQSGLAMIVLYYRFGMLDFWLGPL